MKKKWYNEIHLFGVCLIVIGIIVLCSLSPSQHEEKKMNQRQNQEQLVITAAQNQNPNDEASFQVISKTKRDHGEVAFVLENQTTGEQQTFVVEENGDVYQEVQAHFFR